MFLVTLAGAQPLQHGLSRVSGAKCGRQSFGEYARIPKSNKKGPPTVLLFVAYYSSILELVHIHVDFVALIFMATKIKFFCARPNS